MKEGIWGLLSGILVVAILFMLVKPKSPAAAGIASVTGALSDMISLAINGTSKSNG